MADASLENLRSTIEELTLDIGRILHANTSTLLMVNQTLTSTIETLAAKGVAPQDIDTFEVEPLPSRGRQIGTFGQTLTASRQE